MIRKVLLAFIFLFLLAATANGQESAPATTPADSPVVEFFFFWSQTCPHCRDAIPFVIDLAERRPWLRAYALDVSTSYEAGEIYQSLAARFGEEARSVPGFIFCDTFLTGYDNEAGIGAEIVRRLDRCHEWMVAEGLAEIMPGAGALPPHVTQGISSGSIRLPLIGAVVPGEWSLPLLTVVIAGLDAFNPCAFFVLLFLLSIVVHTRSRRRILLIGGLFVTISGIIYFAFMAAWLNVFLLFGEIPLITRIAGGVAVILALINIKDYFWFRTGPTLSIPDAAKPGLFQRMRGLTSTTSLPVLLGATVALAITVNLYEILCTMGFPMVYTRILTISEVDVYGYYGYLALYNLVYVLPMAVIVTLFAYTLGSRKLQEHEGRALKLLAGMMMLGLGAVLLFAPELLNDPLIATGLVVAAMGVTAVVVFASRRRGGGKHPSARR
jgi:thiol-disulfide isomerase/thioredoxin